MLGGNIMRENFVIISEFNKNNLFICKKVKKKNPCKSCGEMTKYDCISCCEYACLRPECSVAEPKECVPGWQEFKSVSYCMSCKFEHDLRNKESNCKESKCASTCSTSSTESTRSLSPFDCLNENGESGTEGETSDSDSDCQTSRSLKQPSKSRKSRSAKQPRSGRKAMWQDSQITDMVDMIVNDEELVRKLIFTNVKKRKNSDAYEKILPKLNKKYQDETGKDFPFTVKQMRNKFKWCISTCKRICLTVKTATGVKRFVESKGYGGWFNVLYPLVKSRDSCKPENATEPSAKVNEDNNDSTSEDSLRKVEGDKDMFVPVKRKLMLLQTTIKNDPTKELLQILKDDMQHSREQEMRQFNMLCDLIRSNQSN